MVDADSSQRLVEGARLASENGVVTVTKPEYRGLLAAREKLQRVERALIE